jgi:uncharacterized protein DUF3631
MDERVPYLSPSSLLEKLHALEEAPWKEWCHGKPITARGVSNLLRPYGISSELKREAGTPGRRYYREAFFNAWVDTSPSPPKHPFQALLRYMPNKYWAFS